MAFWGGAKIQVVLIRRAERANLPKEASLGGEEGGSRQSRIVTTAAATGNLWHTILDGR